jgi:hypothetical protein
MKKPAITTIATCTALIVGTSTASASRMPTSQVNYGQRTTNHHAAIFRPGGNNSLLNLSAGKPGLESIGPDGTYWSCTMTGTLIVVPAKNERLFGVTVRANQATSLVPSGAFSPSAFSQEVGQCIGTSVDRSGNLYISTWTNNQIIVVPAATQVLFGQHVTANVPTAFNPGATGLLAQLLNATPTSNPQDPSILSAGEPDQVVQDKAGNLFIDLQGPNEVAVVPKASGMVFGQHVTANVPVVLTNATNGLFSIDALGFDSNGDLLLSDYNDPTKPQEPSRIGVLAATTHKLFGQRVVANIATILNPGGHGALSTALGIGGGGQIVFTKAGDLLTIAFNQGVLVAIPGAGTHSLFGQSVKPLTPVRINPRNSGLSRLLQAAGAYGLVQLANGSLLITNDSQPGSVVVLAGP